MNTWRFIPGYNAGCCASFEHGIWWLRVGRLVFILRASWKDPLFSERYGYDRFRIPLGGGWRFLVKFDRA